jgi:8-oxo-dGTP diphosphatase
MKPDAAHFVALKAFVRRGGSALLLNDPTHGLDFPGGKIQEGEIDLAAALTREVAEETGLSIEIGAPFVAWIEPKHPATLKTGVPVLLIGFRCAYLTGDVALSDEHDAFRWLGLDEIESADDGSSYFAALKTYRECELG